MAWYEQWFADELYLEVYRHRDEEEARKAVNLFLEASGLRPRSTVLDLACGTGRHAFEFARRGYRVLAVDLSTTLLRIAGRKTRRYGDSVAIVRADMRHIPLKGGTDAAVQLFTAFGYFPEDGENAAVIGEVAKALKPGGFYMLDFLHASHVAATLQPRTVREMPGGWIIEERNTAGERIEKRITIIRPEGERRFIESVRLFTPAELRAMLIDAGFHILHIFGDYDGGSFHRSAERCIFLSQRAYA
ncbi:MAG: methyltransferase domain-containing protein [Bacteroidota bacterium]|nr:methyltransferase domain-containing protein [Bacteroidota bacterium]